MMSTSSFFKTDDQYMYLEAPYAEAYIPESFFGRVKESGEAGTGIASEYGNGFQVIGIFNMRFFKDRDHDREKVPSYTFVFPNIIETYPSKSVKMSLVVDGIAAKYRVFQYERGDIICNAESTQSVTNCEKFMALITTGKIPRSLSYPDILNAWNMNFDINKISASVPSVVLQAIIAEVCRNPKNPAEPFRKIAGKGEANMKGYRPVNLNEIAAYSSVTAALSFERIAEKLTTCFNMSYSNAPQKKSPIEQVMTM